MRLDLSPGLVIVTLSRRNLLTLLVKLVQPESYRMVISQNGFDENGDSINDTVLVVRAEDDSSHYQDRPAPGPMHPDTEALLKRIGHQPEPREPGSTPRTRRISPLFRLRRS